MGSGNSGAQPPPCSTPASYIITVASPGLDPNHGSEVSPKRAKNDPKAIFTIRISLFEVLHFRYGSLSKE